MQSTSTPRQTRRFTIVELSLVLGLGALLAAVIIPVARDKGEGTAKLTDLRAVQDAVRTYKAETNSYPTFPAVPAPDQTASAIWAVGEIPGPNSIPSYAGIDFGATALKPGQENPIRFFPDYLTRKPPYDDQVADDKTQRWRIDSSGTVSVHLDGRSY